MKIKYDACTENDYLKVIIGTQLNLCSAGRTVQLTASEFRSIKLSHAPTCQVSDDCTEAVVRVNALRHKGQCRRTSFGPLRNRCCVLLEVILRVGDSAATSLWSNSGVRIPGLSQWSGKKKNE